MSQFDHINREPDDGGDILNSFDLGKFLFVLKKSLIWILALVVIAASLAFIYVRYTKPVFESTSIIKLDFESEATTLGLAKGIGGSGSGKELSGEIELLKSRLFFSKVLDVVNIDVSYHYYGRYLTDERYKNNPFVVSYKVKNSGFYDRPLDLNIIGENSFEIYLDGSFRTYEFGEEITTANLNLLIEKTSSFNYPGVEGRYYFQINSRNAMLAYLQKSVSVLPENFSARTIRISLVDNNVYKAKDLITAIDTLYLDYTKEAKNLAIEQKIKFLNSQVDVTEEKLETFESYFEDFIIENRTVSLDADLVETIGYLKALDSSRLRLKMHLVGLEKLENQFEENDSLLVFPIGSSLPDGYYNLVNEFRQTKATREEKLYSYNANTHAIRQLDGKLEEIRSAMKTFIPDQKEAIRNQIRSVEKRSRELEEQFVKLPSMNTAFDKNRRFYSLHETYLMSLWKSRMDLEITKAGTVTNYVILEPASLPSQSIKPKPALIYGAAVAIALVLSFIFLLIRYLLHNTISSVPELESLTSTPILGVVPEYKDQRLMLTKLIIKPSSKSAISEALRAIRTNMEFLNGTDNAKMLTITSTVSGEGKTFIAVNLGAIIAFSNVKVCVVDLDMRKPKVHLAFEDEPSAKGMSTLLIGKNTIDECVRESVIENLHYIPAGPNPPNPSELILGEQYDSILAKLKDRYDLVILDTPPVGLVTDAVMSMKKSDLQLYVVRSDYSKRAFAKSVEDLRKSNRFSNLTVIFNSVKTNSRGYGYGYGYGYYEDSAD